MNILITGIPGTGKTKISKQLGLVLKNKVINDKSFSKKHALGKENFDKEYVVSTSKLNSCFSHAFKKNQIYEGHLWCELSSKNLKLFDYVFVLVASKKLLTERLKERKYLDLKIIENIFCQDINYIPLLLEEKKVSFKIIKVDNKLDNNCNKIMEKINYGKSISDSTSSKCKRDKKKSRNKEIK